MSIIVQKFGGTSIANIERIKHVAQLVAAEVNQGHQVVAVVSAMAGVTNQLIDWVNETADRPPEASEYDVVVSTGEQVSCGLLSLALQKCGISVRSWLGWQLPILTDAVHKRAQIEHIDPKAILASINQGNVAVVSGFQGMTQDQRLTTLGRGGSDTTAVALAHVLEAARCDIYTDVEGVFTADPRIVPEARKLDKISYEEMLEFSWQGAKVLQPRSVAWAMRRRVPLRVLSSFTGAPGTWVVDTQEIPDPPLVTGLATNTNVTMFRVFDVAEQEELWLKLLQPFDDSHIHVDMRICTPAKKPGCVDLVFTTSTEDRELAIELLQQAQANLGFQCYATDSQVAQVAVVGRGIQDHEKIQEKIAKSLAQIDIVPQVMATSDMKVGVLLAKGQAIEAIRILHSAFGLAKAEVETQVA